MSGSSPPPDHSVELAKMQQDAADKAAAQAKQDKIDAEAAFQSQLGSAYNNSIADAEQYFQSRGLNPDDYLGQISSAAQRARGSVPDLTTNPQTYFDNLGANVFTNAQDAARANYMREINSFAPADFQTRRIDNSVDDPFINSIIAEQRTSADQYIRNLLDRGVITSAGFGAAEKDLDNQQPGANARLNEVSLGQLEQGRDSLSNIASSARQAASNYQLGSSFDPYQYQKDIDASALDFFTNLGQRIRAAAPSNLFSTSGLAGIAGAAQGAGNTAFNPLAVAGVPEDDTTNNKPSKTNTASNPF